jgi:hypothetical protein
MNHKLRPTLMPTLGSICQGPRFFAAAIAFLVCLGALDAQGGLITPSGLNPGDQFRFIFLSSGKTDATSTDILVYDAFVQGLASTAGLTYPGATVTWQALGSTATGTAGVNANDQGRLPLGDSIPIYRLDGTRVANNSTHLFTPNPTDILALINVNEYGLTIAQDLFVWTGTAPTGSATINPLGSSGPNQGPTLGYAGSLNDWWITQFNNINNTDAYRMYAYSNILQVPLPDVPAIPEPASLVLCLLGASVMVGVRRLNQRRRRG